MTGRPYPLAAALLAALLLIASCSLALAKPTAATKAATAPATPHALIEQVLAAYGGRAALDTVRAYRCEGTVFAMRSHDEAPSIRVFARPDRFKILIQYQPTSEVRIVDGAKGWRSSRGDSISPATGMMLDAMSLQAARADLPWILAERESLVRFVAADSATLARMGGKSVSGLEVPLAGGLLLHAFVDSETHRVAFSEGIMPRVPMAPKFEVSYSDYRPVNGVWFAFKELSSASGMPTGATTIKSIVVNPPIRLDEFVPPGPIGTGPAAGH